MKHSSPLAVSLLNLVLALVMAVSARVMVPRFDFLTAVDWTHDDLGAAFVLIAAAIVSVCVILPVFTIGLAIASRGRTSRTHNALSAGIALLLLAVPVLWIGYGRSLASREENRVDRAWARTLEPMEAFLARYPAGPSSQGSLDLEQAADRLGIKMRHPFDEGAPGRPERVQHEAVRKKLWEFVSSQTNNTGEAPDAPPEEVAAWLSAHRLDIAALITQVRQGGPIAFETDWSKEDQPIPPLFGLRAVTNVLVIYASESERGGDSRSAIEALEASWRVGGALRDRGEELSQVTSSALDGMTLSALRKARDLPPSSPLRTTAYDYRTSMLHAFQGEAWGMSAMIRRYITITAQQDRSPGRWSWRILYLPYLRLTASDYSDAIRKGVEDLKKTDPCRIDWAGLEVLERKNEDSLGWWNLHGRMRTLRPARPWLSAVRTALSLELTQKVLAIRTVEKEHGAWPAELPDLQSEVCPGSRWTYSAPGDGRVSLTLETSPALGPPLAFRAFRPRP